MAVMMINIRAVYIMCGVYSECSVPKMKGGWMTRVTPVNTRQRVIISKMPQASLRKMQERRDTQTGLIEAIMVTSAMGRYLKRKIQCIREQKNLTAYVLPATLSPVAIALRTRRNLEPFGNGSSPYISMRGVSCRLKDNLRVRETFFPNQPEW